MSQKIVILSPHLDDAVFSCWYQINRSNSQVVTIFAGIPNNKTPGSWGASLGQANAREAMRLRRHENNNALQDTNTEITNLDFLDAPYRSSHQSIVEIVSKLDNIIPHDAIIIAPAGISRYHIFHITKGHEDHIITRHVAQSLMKLGRHVEFYADLPYMIPRFNFQNWPKFILKKRIERVLGMDIEIKLFKLSPEQQRSKRNACLVYKSQFQAFRAFKRPGAYRWEIMIHPK